MNTQEQQLTQYRRLEMGEIVLATDEIYDDNTREWVEPEWSVGKPAPDPDCTSHRQFRRKINSLPNTPEQQLSESLLAACKAAGIENPRYIAQNANGKVIHHDNQPSRKGWDSIWGGGGIPKRLNHPPYADNWQDSLLEWVDHIADTSKKFDMQDAIADAYRKHVGRCGLQTYAQTYRHGWQDALAWKGGGDQARGIEALVCDDIAKRQQAGIAKYGTTVAENMLSHTQWLQHAYEECLDMAVYLKRAMAELQTTSGKIEIENEDY